jgi:threonine dehydrogenase-like Zn-dependent dehydrogenase
MPVHRYPDLLGLINSGQVEPQRLIAKTVSLEQTGEELAAMANFQQQGVTVIDSF